MMDYPAPVIMIDGNGESSLCKYLNHTSSRRVCSEISEISSGLDVDVDVAMANCCMNQLSNCINKYSINTGKVVLDRNIYII